MKPVLLVASGIGALAAVLVLSRKPKPSFQYVPIQMPLPRFDKPPVDAAEAQARLAVLKQARPDADVHGADGYSRYTFQITDAPGYGPWTYSAGGYLPRDAVPANPDAPPGAVNPAVLAAEKKYGIKLDHYSKHGSPIDEYGRPWHGVSGNPFGVMLTAAGLALPFVPGIGPAASATLAAAIAIGQGKSVEDAAVAAVRNAIPGGALGRMAFDFGVGLANGASVDEAAESAFVTYLAENDPDTLVAYNAGKKLGKGIVT